MKESLFYVVVSCCAKFETSQTFSYVQTDATTLDIILLALASNVGSFCVPLHVALGCLSILRMTAIQFLQSRIKGPGRCQAENKDFRVTRRIF